jgi:hypothetical protein
MDWVVKAVGPAMFLPVPGRTVLQVPKWPGQPDYQRLPMPQFADEWIF